MSDGKGGETRVRPYARSNMIVDCRDDGGQLIPPRGLVTTIDGLQGLAS